MFNNRIIDQCVVKEMNFDCDLIITDPCYIIPRKDRARDDYSLHMRSVQCIENETLYGDWSCTVWKANDYSECIKENELGTFCADAGMVVVANYEDVKMVYPEVKQFIEDHPWCVTIIKGFKGTVQMIKVKREYIHTMDFYPEKSYGYKKGDKFTEMSLELFGKGNINWISIQTGL